MKPLPARPQRASTRRAALALAALALLAEAVYVALGRIADQHTVDAFQRAFPTLAVSVFAVVAFRQFSR